MARKKEYTVGNDDSANDDDNKREKKSATPNDAHKKADINRAKLAAKRKEITSAGTSSRSVYDVGDLRAQLGSFGLTVRDIPGDGNCLFRALGDQLDGHTGNHVKHRLDTVRYMIAHKGHFEPFIDVPFDRYITEMSRLGTYAGQDALVAFARLHKVNIIIHQLNRPLWKIQGIDICDAPELHLSYHNGEHYSSVRRFGDIADTPAGIRIMGPTAIPCCASHSIFTSTKPITAKADSESRSPTLSEVIQGQNNLLSGEDSNSSEQTFIRDEDDFTNFVQEVMNRTGCRDSSIATEALIENAGDIDQTVDYLLSLALFFNPLEQNGIIKKEKSKIAVAASECKMSKICNINESDTIQCRTLPRMRTQLVRSKERGKPNLSENVQKGTQTKQSDLSFLTL